MGYTRYKRGTNRIHTPEVSEHHIRYWTTTCGICAQRYRDTDTADEFNSALVDSRVVNKLLWGERRRERGRGREGERGETIKEGGREDRIGKKKEMIRGGKDK